MNKNFKYRLITSLLCFIIFTCSLGAFTTVSSGRVYAEKDKKEMNNEKPVNRLHRSNHFPVLS